MPAASDTPRRLRQMELTEDLVARCRREVAPQPPRPGRVPLSPEGALAVVDRLRAGRPPGPLGVFGYGSLLWNPGIPVESWERALLPGFHRSFCLHMEVFRGTPEAPGLMMALAPGGRCVGMVARIPEAAEAEALGTLVRREMLYEDQVQNVRWVTVRTRSGAVPALVFWVRPRVAAYVPRLPLPEVARRVARACGPGGSNADYLRSTVAHLEGMGIRDRNLWTLQKLVAAEIREASGLAP